MEVELRGIYKEYEQEVIDTINKMVEEYPVLNEVVKIIHIENVPEQFKDCFAVSRFIPENKIQYEIKLNPVVFGKENLLTHLHMARPRSYYFDASDIIVHELAHSLQIFYLCHRMNINIKKYKYFWRMKYKLLVSKKAEKHCKEYFIPFFEKFEWTDDIIKNRLGTYAHQNATELLPECFNNYYHLRKVKEFASGEQETYEFVKAVVEDYKKYIPEKL